jgi:hypothetical protein
MADYDEMTSAIENINSYFLGMYGRYTDFDEEVKEMVKSFYDPKVEERGIEKGATEKALRVAEKMLRRGDSVEDIVDMTELPKEKVIELKKKYQN